MDGLFGQSGIDCRMGNQYPGALGYANCLTLMVSSPKGLQSLIHICEDYADEYILSFNQSKHKFMIFKGCDCYVKKCFITMNNVPLMNIDKGVHFGHNISKDDNDSIVN